MRTFSAGVFGIVLRAFFGESFESESKRGLTGFDPVTFWVKAKHPSGKIRRFRLDTSNLTVVAERGFTYFTIGNYLRSVEPNIW